MAVRIELLDFKDMTSCMLLDMYKVAEDPAVFISYFEEADSFGTGK
jgi:hypothetical protein